MEFYIGSTDLGPNPDIVELDIGILTKQNGPECFNPYPDCAQEQPDIFGGEITASQRISYTWSPIPGNENLSGNDSTLFYVKSLSYYDKVIKYLKKNNINKNVLIISGTHKILSDDMKKL